MADEAAGEAEEGLVDVGAAFVADAEAAVLVEPGEGSFDDPALAPESRAMGRISSGDEWSSAASTEFLPVGL